MTARTDDGIIVWESSDSSVKNVPEKSETKTEDIMGLSTGESVKDVLPEVDVTTEDVIIEEKGRESSDLVSTFEIAELDVHTDILEGEDSDDDDTDDDTDGIEGADGDADFDNSVYEKKYYKISEVVTIVNETQPTIRFWEDSFAELGKNFCSFRSRKGTRKYTKENIENLKLIKMLLRERRLTIEGAISEIRKEKKRNAKDRALILLQETRDELNSLIDAYNCILHKNVNE